MATTSVSYRSSALALGRLLVLWTSVAMLARSTLAEPTAESPPPAEAKPPTAEAIPPPAEAASPPAEASPTPPPEASPPPTKNPSLPSPPEAQPTAVGQPGADPSAKLVRLDFQGQEWLPVLEWLAKTRGLNLDWQQLPEGTLNLSSTKQYSVEEAADLINMQLLARGFTLLERGEVLRVAPLKDLDITLVPKVNAEELAKLPRHEFVRVTFPLTWMIAEEAATEFKPLISPYGQLYPMASSNRLEAMDAVVNLRELHRLLTRSEADEGRRERVAEFQLKFRKAEEVAAKVRQLLGLPAGDSAAASTLTQLDIEQAKLRTEAVKALGTSAQPLLKDKPDVHLVVNDKENSILVNGRPDKIEIARQAIEAMDKPLPPGESSWESMNRVKVYEVSGFDPATISQLMQALQERGNISKETRVQYEATYNRLVVFASPEDQVTVGNVIASFRTQGRRAEVLPLTRIDPQYASKAVQLVLKNPARPSAAPGAASDGKFQVEPDIANNRLLLWATPGEMTEVREFLARLGENFSNGPAASQMHVVHLRGAKSAEVMKRLGQVWKEFSDTPLLIENNRDGSTQPATSVTPTVAPTPAADPAPQVTPTSDRSATFRPAAKLVVQQQAAPPAPASAAIAEQAPAASSANEPPKAAEEHSPVRVIPGDDGEVLILSRDPVAAETAKQLVEQIVPADKDVEVIPLQHAQAASIKLQLETLLLHTRSAESPSLTSQEPLRIEPDTRTNRLMIQHATPKQMELINQMVPLLDQPEQEDKRLVRQQRVYRAQRKRAGELAEIVKEVYRDLLSAGDKIFLGREGNQRFGYNRAMAATAKSPEYQGLLSVGVDAEDNTLILSAPEYLMDEVLQLVELVDTNASEKAVTVVPLKKPETAKAVKESLAKILAKPQ